MRLELINVATNARVLLANEVHIPEGDYKLVVVVGPPSGGDDTAEIQRAINLAAGLRGLEFSRSAHKLQDCTFN